MGQVRTIIKRLSETKLTEFWPGFVFGLVYFGYIFWWFWSLYPLDTLGVSSKFLSFILVCATFSISIIGMAFFWGLFSFFSIKILPKQQYQYLAPWYLASMFVLIEYARAWGFGILWLGSGSLLGPHWTIGNPAYFFGTSPILLGTASIWGIYGIDFIIVFIISAICTLVYFKKRKTRFIVAGEIILVIGVIALTHLLTIKPPQEQAGVTFSVIQTENQTKIYYTPGEILTDFSQKNAMLKSATNKSDLIIFPEGADFSQTLTDFLSPAAVQKYFNNLAPENRLIIDSDAIMESSELKSKVIFIDSKQGIVGFYDKQLLTPAGEFIPYLLKFPFLIIGHISGKSPEVATEFTKGSGTDIITYQDNTFKILVCSEIISPLISRTGSFGFMINIDSLGIFKGDSRMNSELLSSARFRAAENGKYLIMASNYGQSYLINSAGSITDSTSSSGYQILTGTIVPNKTRTWYNRLGDWPILLLSVLFFSLGLISKKCPGKSRLF